MVHGAPFSTNCAAFLPGAWRPRPPGQSRLARFRGSTIVTEGAGGRPLGRPPAPSVTTAGKGLADAL